MATRSVATVFGGSGFIGRYVVKRLLAKGHVVRVAGRDTEAARQAMVVGRVGQVVPLYVSLSNEASVLRAAEGADIVVNLVGILAERRPGDFQRIQAEGAARIARAAAAHARADPRRAAQGGAARRHQGGPRRRDAAAAAHGDDARAGPARDRVPREHRARRRADGLAVRRGGARGGWC